GTPLTGRNRRDRQVRFVGGRVSRPDRTGGDPGANNSAAFCELLRWSPIGGLAASRDASIDRIQQLKPASEQTEKGGRSVGWRLLTKTILRHRRAVFAGVAAGMLWSSIRVVVPTLTGSAIDKDIAN